jgi:Cu/Ag efflux protein CusF
MIGLTMLLAACSQKAENDESAMANTATETTGAMSEMAGTMSGDRGAMTMPAETRVMMVKGTGTVTAIDRANGSVTLDHEPIPEANWPAMIMAFEAKPELLERVKVGDRVAFDLALKEGAGEVTAIKKQ